MSTVVVQRKDRGPWTKTTRTSIQNLCDKDRTAYNKEQQTCESDTNPIIAIPQGSAFQGKNGHTIGHNKTVWKWNQYDNNLEYIEDKQDRYATYMKDNTANDPEIDRAVGNKISSKLSNSTKRRWQNSPQQMNTAIQHSNVIWQNG